jgi:hypothetical protein
MSRFLDARIPVVFASEASETVAGDAVLVEGAADGFEAGSAHVAGCSCCTGRSSAARALSALFIDRARGRRAFFGRVVVVCATQAGRDSVCAALAEDVLVSGWFRKDPPYFGAGPKTGPYT